MRREIRRLLFREFERRIRRALPEARLSRGDSCANHRVYRVPLSPERTGLLIIQSWDLGDRFTLEFGWVRPNRESHLARPALKWSTIAGRAIGGRMRIGDVLKPYRDRWWDVISGKEYDSQVDSARDNREWSRLLKTGKERSISSYRWRAALNEALGHLFEKGLPLLFTLPGVPWHEHEGPSETPPNPALQRTRFARR